MRESDVLWEPSSVPSAGTYHSATPSPTPTTGDSWDSSVLSSGGGTVKEGERRQQEREEPSVYQCTPPFLSGGKNTLFSSPLLLSDVLRGAIT